MTLSNDDIRKEVESWGRFADALRAEDRDLFKEMMRLCHQYAPSIQVSPSSGEALFMSLLLIQHKTILWMEKEIEDMKRKLNIEGLDP
ncbi:MAG TPA: hypothetical protein VJ044_13295 [Candidatus Hodarchaeales archaeon]|nr:hypothetical protein [Candidatus Hodarchaeales archaeon]